MVHSAADQWKKLKGPKSAPQRSAPARRQVARGRLPSYTKSVPEAVVKVTAWGKSFRSAVSMAEYIAQGSEHVQSTEQLIDQDGVAHDLADINDLLAAEWGLKPEAENLSPAARDASADDRGNMREAQRLQARQVAHIVLSWPKTFPITRQQAETAAAETFRPLTDAGHKSLMVFHLDEGRPHVHVILQARNPETGRALTIGPAEIQSLRKRQADITREITGHHMQATRREERPDLAKEIAEGREPLRTKSARQKPTLIERQAPGWYARHGYQWETRRLNWRPTAEPMPPQRVDLPKLNERAEAALEKWGLRFTNADGEAAKQRWREMAAENPRTAFWYANHRPEVFGALRPVYSPYEFTGRQAPIPTEWQEAAAAALAQAAADPAVEGHRLDTTQRLRELREAQQRQERADYMEAILPAETADPPPPEPPPALVDRIPGLRAFASLYEAQPGEEPWKPTPEGELRTMEARLGAIGKEVAKLEDLRGRFIDRGDKGGWATDRIGRLNEEARTLHERIAEIRGPQHSLVDRIPGLRSIVSLYQPPPREKAWERPPEDRLRQIAKEVGALASQRRRLLQQAEKAVPGSKTQNDLIYRATIAAERTEALRIEAKAIHEGLGKTDGQTRSVVDRIPGLRALAGLFGARTSPVDPHQVDAVPGADLPEAAQPAPAPQRPPATLDTALDTIERLITANDREAENLEHMIGVFQGRHDKGNWATERLQDIGAQTSVLQSLADALVTKPADQTVDQVAEGIVNAPLHAYLAETVEGRIAVNNQELDKLQGRTEGWVANVARKLIAETNAVGAELDRFDRPVIDGPAAPQLSPETPAPTDGTAPSLDPEAAAEDQAVAAYVARTPGLRRFMEDFHREHWSTPTRGDVLRATDRLIAYEARNIERLQRTRDRLDQAGQPTTRVSKDIAKRTANLNALKQRRDALRRLPTRAGAVARRIAQMSRAVTRPGPTRGR